MSNVEQYGKTAANKLEDLAEGAVETGTDLADRAGKQATVAGREINKAAGSVKGAVEDSLSSQPMATLAMAAAAGFLLGAIWKS